MARLMRYELDKIIHDRIVPEILLLLLVVPICFSAFQLNVNGKVLKEQKAFHTVNTSEETGNPEDSEDYDAWLNRIMEQAQEYADSPFAGSGNGYEKRNAKKTAAVYRKLYGRKIDSSYCSTIKTVAENSYSDIFLCLAAVLLVMALILRDYQDGMVLLIHSTRYGKTRAILPRLAVIESVLAAMTGILYFCEFLLAVQTGQVHHLGRTVQSLYIGSPWRISLLQFMVFFICLKILGVLVIAAVIAMLGIGLKKNMPVCASAAVIFAGEYFLWKELTSADRGAVFHEINLFSFLDAAGKLSDYYNIRLLNWPVNSFYVVLAAAGLLLFLCILASYGMYQKPAVGFARKKKRRSGKSRKHCFLAFLPAAEMYKLLIKRGALPLLAVLCLFQVYQVRTTEYYTDKSDYYYNYYAKKLEGPLSEKKADFLKKEQARIDSMQREADKIYEKYEKEEISDAALEWELEKREITEPQQAAFRRAKKQYQRMESCQESGYRTQFINQLGWDRLNGDYGQDRMVTNVSAWSLFAVLACGTYFTMEAESGVRVLQNTYQKKKRFVLWIKGLVQILYLLALFAIVQLPMNLQVWKTYRMRLPGASHLSILCSRTFLPGMSVLQWLILMNVVRALGIFAVGFVLYLLACLCRRSGLVLILGTVILLLPAVLYFSGLAGQTGFLYLLTGKAFFAGASAF